MPKKRLWDTSKVKAAWEGAKYRKCQLWTNEDGSKLYVYDHSKWYEYNPATSSYDAVYYDKGPGWVAVADDDVVGYYETSKPTDLYTWESGDEVSYKFKDYDGTVLKSGKVDEGTAPTPPADPTRSATAQYTYTFSGWNPTVGKIYKKTEYTAQYTSTVNEYDLTIAVDDDTHGSVDVSSVENVPYGTAISSAENVLTIGTGSSKTEITATAEEGYVFSSWGTLPSSVTGDATITATFEAAPEPEDPTDPEEPTAE